MQSFETAVVPGSKTSSVAEQLSSRASGLVATDPEQQLDPPPQDPIEFHHEPPVRADPPSTEHTNAFLRSCCGGSSPKAIKEPQNVELDNDQTGLVFTTMSEEELEEIDVVELALGHEGRDQISPDTMTGTSFSLSWLIFPVSRLPDEETTRPRTGCGCGSKSGAGSVIDPEALSCLDFCGCGGSKAFRYAVNR